ncbi:zf-CHY-domain-containing protein, partial [Pseudovirgaria hyperparasitica]
MTEGYAVAHLETLRPNSPPNIASPERPYTPNSTLSQPDTAASASISPVSSVSLKSDDPYNICAADLEPSYRPIESGGARVGETEEPHSEDSDDDGPCFGCKHYKRNVKVQCYDCRKWYPCRHCHDEVEKHALDRRKTEHMLCVLCQTPQPASGYCRACGRCAAWYYCDICKLWDDDTSKKIYHCLDCGICRVGEGIGKDYVHCKKCNVCISIGHADSHRCIERATECDCPICGEYLFNSSADVASMPCGHYMHKGCYKDYLDVAYKCPFCKKSVINMELSWRKLTHDIESQPMPPQFDKTRVNIQCNDCSAKSNVKYHWLGNKCNTC